MAKKKPSNPPSDSTPPASDAKNDAKTYLFQDFERATALRSSLRPHPSNPRSIDPHARKKLKENLRRVGLVTSLCVNRRTVANGFPASQEGVLVIVGGHQRCSVMDELRKYDKTTHENDYQIPIDMVCISPAREMELLVSLNNSALMGNYDLDLLAEVLTYPGVEPLATGFDKLDLRGMLDSGICDQILGEESPQGVAEAPVLAAIAEISADSKQYTKDREAAAIMTPGQPNPAITGPVQPVATQPADDINSVQSIKERRQQFQNHVSDAGVEAHLTLVANTAEDVEHLLRSLGLPPNSAFLDLTQFIEAMERPDLLLADEADEEDLQEMAEAE